MTISGTLGSAFKNDAATPANIPSGSLAFLIVDDGNDGFLNKALVGSITAGSKDGQTGLKIAVADAGIAVGSTFGGDKILSIATVGSSGSIGPILPSTGIASYVGKSFAVVWFTKSAATINSGGIAGEYFGIIRGADWVLPTSDAGTFTINSTDSGGATSYYSYSASATAVQVGATGFFTGSGTAAAAGSTAVRTATFQVVLPKPPTIATQPASQTAIQGGSVNLSVTAVGGGPYSYQWKKDGLDIFEATNATLTLNNVQFADAGSYSVVVTNTLGMATSDGANLTVVSAIWALFSSAESALAVTDAGLVNLSPIDQLSVVTGAASHSGSGNALKFQTVDDGSTFAERTIVGPAVVSFSWRVSSEQDFDLFQYSVDGSVRETISGNGAWLNRSLTLGAGNHTIRWTYSKDEADANFDDAGYLDDLVIVESYTNLEVSSAGNVITGSSTLDFGTVPQNAPEITQSLTLKNTGTISQSVTTTLPTDGGFVFSSGLYTASLTLSAGQQSTLVLKMLTTVAGYKSTLLGITATGSRTAAPAITLRGNVQAKAPNIVCSWSGGEITSDQSTAIHFGATPSDLTITVNNTGETVMNLASVNISPAGNFQVISQPSSTVAINGSTTFTLRALDANRGNHTATVTIASDAANVPSFNIPVASESNPKIECSWSGGAIASGQGTAVDFGATPSEVVITIASTGTAALNLASVSVSPAGDFQVISQPSSTVAVGSTTTLRLRALDASRGIHQATVTIANNDADTPYFRFPLVSKSYLAVVGTAGATGSFSNSGTTIGWDLATTTLTNGSSGQAIKTGATPNSGDSTIGATFEGPGLLSWNWKVSAQQGFDWLLCEVNSTEVAGISTKTAAWQSQVVQIPAGSQVRWIYRKDATNQAGTDSGYLSDIRFSKFTAVQSSFSDWSAAHGNLAPTQAIPTGGMQAMFAWLGGVDPATGPSAGQYQPSVSGGFYKYRYTVAKTAAGIVQPQISTDLATWNSRRIKQTLISEDETSAVVELSVPATGKLFSRFATEMPTYVTDMVQVQGGNLPSSSPLGAQNVATFYIAKTETTWGQWQTVRTWAVAHGYDLANVGAGNGDSFPVTDVNWYHVVKWCNARSEMEGLTPVYTVNGSIYRTGDFSPDVKANANGYRLPGEAEWEFAARGGASTHGYDYSGSSDWNAVAWCWDNTGYPTNTTHSVATKQANELGLSDMSGNVWEWCYDWYPGYEGSYRVIRGGSWNSNAYYCRVAFRSYNYPSNSFGHYGFRVARSSVPQ